MFSKLPDLFDRNFAVAYFLPITAFIVASLALLNNYSLLLDIPFLNMTGDMNTLVGTTIVALLSWVGAVILLALNRDILRLMEGYGILNPARLFLSWQKRRYRILKTQITTLDNEYLQLSSNKKEIPQALIAKRSRLLRTIVEQFPDEERWLLPTAFGNIIRAFEVYPRVMYGLDSIPGWNRLLAVIPIEYRGLIDDAKSQVDFWANSWILSLLFMGEYLAVSLQQANFQLLWLPVLMVIIYILSYARAKSAAAEWGDFVKAAFDIYLPELQRKLGFPNQNSISEERQLWSRFSRAIIYVNSEHMPQRDDKTEDQKSASKASRVA